jgi:hypothetical protein
MLVWWEFGRDDGFRASPFFKETVLSVFLSQGSINSGTALKVGVTLFNPLGTLDTTFNYVAVMDGGRGVSRMLFS